MWPAALGSRHRRETAVSTTDFTPNGFVVIRNAVAPDIVRACIQAIEEQLHVRGVDPRDPST